MDTSPLLVEDTFRIGFLFVCFLRFIYLSMRNTQRETETQEEGEIGSRQEARCGTQSQVSGIISWAEGGAKPLSHWGCPSLIFKVYFF